MYQYTVSLHLKSKIVYNAKKKSYFCKNILQIMANIYFNQLKEEEKSLLLNAPALVTCLIAGAEDAFNAEEEERAKHLIRIRTNNGDPLLLDFYKEVEENFDDQLSSLIGKYGSLQATPRTEVMVSELSKLNEILPKVDDLFARAYIKSLRTLAHSIAESSGGILGFLAVSYEESHLIGLEMITYQP